jgi:O-antigen/teichoic acid export membrane protein
VTIASPGVSALPLYLLPTALGMMLPFLTLPVMTRWLAPADYGIVAIAQVVATFFMGLSTTKATVSISVGSCTRD